MSEPKHHAFLYKRGSAVVYTKLLETHAPNVYVPIMALIDAPALYRVASEPRPRNGGWGG